MDSMDIAGELFGGRIGNSNYIFTPQNIVEDMLNILPENFWTPDKKIIDIYTKSGRFLKEAFKRLYNSPYLADMDIAKRKRHILTEQLYGLTDDFTCLLLSERLLYGCAQYGKKHIKMIKNMVTFVQSQDHKFINNLLEKEFDTMKFDLVIGNPPYNKGMDLDFVDLGYKISDQYTVMITPAKWQTAEANQGVVSKNMTYGKFRQELVPHMSHVVFYPDTHDVFLISQVDGITHFLLEKDIIIEQCIIENRCSMQKYFNSLERRSICTGESLHNIGNEIIEYLTKYPRFKFGTVKGRYQVWINSKIALGGNDAQNNVHILSENTGSCQCIGKCRIIDTNDAISMTSKIVDSNLAFASDNIQDCNSFESWIKTKFIRFFVLINISKLNNVICDTCFRFVPAPPSGKFDHIYTDEELYKAFNLPQKYIDVIEAVIKERK